MRENLLIIGREAAAFLTSGLILLFCMAMVYIDVNWMNNALHENSFTEITQELVLALIAALFFTAAWQRPAQRSALTLVGGFFSCMLIREMDFLFDPIEHGAWLTFALATAAASLAIALRTPRQILSGLAALLQHRQWQTMAAGLLAVLVFSRLFGMHQLWQQLMLDGYHRVVKNMAEEVTELFGYSLCLTASVRYLWHTRPARVAQRQAQAHYAAQSSPLSSHRSTF
ncbi:hypothetical protein LU196_17075 [Pantoea sp. Mb-10]|uniref:hypothetical protein n=1 Tax=unclassified Pantoea TaxID=2630326 RepID=UPI001E54333C|nr:MULTISPECIES: hypothetical protein [unclassified Pantoea]MCE0491746.1 hypothetical protein [Pantoea sp. Mb-10]MCE0502933.1 hypothetical protein [Pantoea sp. Pb-8]